MEMLDNGEDIRELWDGVMDGLVGDAPGRNVDLDRDREQENEGEVDDMPNQIPGGIDGGENQQVDEEEEEEEEEEESEGVGVFYYLISLSTFLIGYFLGTSTFVLTKSVRTIFQFRWRSCTGFCCFTKQWSWRRGRCTRPLAGLWELHKDRMHRSSYPNIL